MTTVTVLSDNRVAASRPMGLRAEWGFAAAVDGVLFDTGQTGLAADNAARLDVGPFETVVLSHGHFDHTGGLPAFVDDAESVYAHPDVFEPKYREEEFVGTAYAREWLASRTTLTTHRDPVTVADGVHALGEIPRPHPDNATGSTVGADGSRTRDALLDDQALAVETGDGLALVLGCCHAGLRNTVEYAEAVLEAPVRTVVGGTHLTAADPDERDRLVSWLGDNVDRIAPTHCTGHPAERALEATFGDAFERVGVGTQVDL